MTALSKRHFVLVPDLRGHGDSGKPRAGYHVARLAMDLHNFIAHLKLDEDFSKGGISAIGTSLGAAILWYVGDHPKSQQHRVTTTNLGATPNYSPRSRSHT